MKAFHALLVSTLLLSACGAPPAPSMPADSGDDVSSADTGPVIPASLDRERLANLSYTLVDMSVRAVLTKAGAGFGITLSDGSANLPSAAAAQGFRRVRSDVDRAAYGDVTGDGVPEAIVPLFISHNDDEILELAGVTDSGSTAVHFASFPIGVAVLNSLNVTSGKIRVNFTHQVRGDPGPRNTELMLELPRK